MPKRRLAAIMFTDIVGYTSLMGSEEKIAFDILKKNRRIHWRLIKKYKGRLLKEMGDGILASFPSGMESVVCALAIQKATLELNIPLRIGIHLGDVIFERRDVLGDGVNIASRIQGVAETNGVVISETVYDNIRNKENLEIEFLGQKSLKGVQSKIGVYRISCSDYSLLDISVDTGELVRPLTIGKKPTIIGLVFIVLLISITQYFIPKWTSKASKAILVLPFENYTGSDSLEYFVAGIHSSLIGELSRISGLSPISPHTSRTYKNTEKSLSEIAEERNVDLIVGAAVMCLGDSICIQPELVSVGKEEKQLWIQNFTKEKSQVYNLYNQISKQISEEINIILTPEEERHLAEEKTVDPRAYREYERGNVHLFQFTPRNIQLALRSYQHALDIDSSFSLAYAGLSDAASYMLVLGMMVPEEAGHMMRENALKSLAIDSLIPEGHFALGITSYAVDWDWDAGMKEFQRAIELKPNDAKFHIFYSHCLASLSRFDEAIEHAEMAVQLDPYNAFFHGLYSAVLGWAGKYEASIERCSIGMEIEPLNPFPVFALSGALHQTGRSEEAFNTLKKANNLIGDSFAVDELDKGYLEGGIESAYKNLAHKLELMWQKTYVKPHLIVNMYSLAKETEKALDWLDTCYIYRDHDMIYSAVNPYYEEIKKHPRYIQLMKKMNLTLE